MQSQLKDFYLNITSGEGTVILELTRPQFASFNGASPWYTFCALGTPSQNNLRFMFDTGTTHSWVTSAKCTTNACNLHRKFNQDVSTSFQYLGDSQNIDFGPWGNMIVRLGKDFLHIKGIDLNISFFESEDYKGTQFEELTWDGAIAIPSITPSKDDSTMFLMYCKENKIIASAMISFVHDSSSRIGRCILGKTPFENLNWVRLVRFDNDPECWTIPLDKISSSKTGTILTDIPLSLDTGSSFFKGDGFTIWKIIKAITNNGEYPTKINAPDRIENYPYPTITLTIQGIDYNLEPKQYFMQTSSNEWHLAFFPMQGLEGLLLVGSVFLETLQCVFDFDNQRIGLASIQENKEKLIPYRNSIIHYEGLSAFPSSYEIADSALKNYNVERDLFGTTTILLPNKSYIVHDYHYNVAKYIGSQEQVAGMYFLPVNDYGDVLDLAGNRLPGYSVIDSFLRKEMELADTDQIFALIAYMHPELNKGTIPDLAKSEKVQLGFTHLGVYTGKNMTTNSPEFYHNNRWMVTGLSYTKFGYPANVQILSLKNVQQKVLNLNAFLVDLILNHGVEFPGDYENSNFEPVYLNAAFMFYRDWISEEDYLRKEANWYTYCAAHKTVVVNIAVNLPHNENAFKEVYGDSEGSILFSKFKDKYRNATGFLFPDEYQTDFSPLWKQEGLTQKEITPFTYQEFVDYDRHRREKTPYQGPLPVWPPRGVAWGPQTTADIIFDFVQIYTDLLDTGGIITCATLYGFMPEVLSRTGITIEQYLYYALPIMEKLMFADARVYAAKEPVPTWEESKYYKTAFNYLYYALGGKETNTELFLNRKGFAFLGTLDEFVTSNPTPEKIADWSMTMIRNKWQELMTGGCFTEVDAYVEFMETTKVDIEIAREMIVTDPNKIEFNTPPAITGMIALGMFQKNDLITIRIVCTAVDMSELQLKNI